MIGQTAASRHRRISFGRQARRVDADPFIG